MLAVLHALPILAATAAVFTALAAVARRCNDTPAWWRKPDLSTDLCYALVLPGLAQYGRIACLTAGLALCRGGPAGGLAGGPLAALPFAGQVGVYLLAADLWLYATHRAFHAAGLWRYHAVHHSSEQLDWISAQRFHPFDLFWHSVAGDCVLLLLGIQPAVLIWLTPFTVGMSALVHANLDWDFGRFRFVLTSPVYHRWHHTAAHQGGSANFAANFPVFDLLFGTCYLPRGARPQRFGVTEGDVPTHFAGQMLHPFRRQRAAGFPAPVDALGSPPAGP